MTSKAKLATAGRDRPRDPRYGEPGWAAGRLIDGYLFAQDARPAVWTPPRWIGVLSERGYAAEADGPLTYVVSGSDGGELARFDDLRDALRAARSLLQSPTTRSPDSLVIDCRTDTGLVAPVVDGPQVLGMANGALDAEPIRVIEAPAFVK